jgi:putative endopeptidase
MTIPAGMLQPPFFDMNRSHAWNYGGIGSAIGHEITHGFDDEGRMYDPEGNYTNWWSTEDERTFNKMSTAVFDLFDGVTYMGGKVDGKLTLSENIADLGGVAIALTALKTELKGKSETDINAAYRDFFTSYAVSWRNKDRPRKAKQALLLDVHSPAPLRVNLIVRNFQEFYDAFGIKEGDPGYVPVEKRVTLW